MEFSIFSSNDATNSSTVYKIVKTDSLESIASTIKRHSWSPGVFKNNHRNLINFIHADILGLDIDGGCTLEEAKEIFKNFQHIIGTTRNHQKDKHGIICDRFRVILFFQRRISKPEDYEATWRALQTKLGFLDEKAKDGSRFFFPISEVISVNVDGKLLEPSKAFQVKQRPKSLKDTKSKGKLSRSTLEFVAHGAAEGSRNDALFKAAVDFYEQGYPIEETEDKLRDACDRPSYEVKATIKSAYNRIPKYDPRSEKRSDDIEKWFQDWIIANKIKYHLDGTLLFKGKRQNLGYLVDRIHIDLVNRKMKSGKGTIDSLFSLWIAEQREVLMDQLRVCLKFSGQNLIIDKFCKALTGKVDPIDKAVIEHFIWQIKRKLYGYLVTRHLMPVICGDTNTGKSTAIRKLCSPVEDLAKDAQLSVVGDSREYAIFAENLVIFMDEMAKAQRVDVDSLKNLITSNKVTYRRLGTNQHVTAPNLSTLIGSSNYPLEDIIRDPTSARRYHQITVTKKCDWKTINAIDYLEMWKSVDEKAEESPIEKILERLQKAQEKHRHKSSFEEWRELRRVEKSNDWSSFSELFSNYRQFMENQHKASYMFGEKKFGEELGKIFEKKQTNSDTLYRCRIQNLDINLHIEEIAL